MIILFPHDKFLQGKILSRKHLPRPSYHQKKSYLPGKISPENVSILPNNKYYV